MTADRSGVIFSTAVYISQNKRRYHSVMFVLYHSVSQTPFLLKTIFCKHLFLPLLLLQEHHLQRAISAQQVYGEKRDNMVIPVPEAERNITHYESLYPGEFKMPKQLIHIQREYPAAAAGLSSQL